MHVDSLVHNVIWGLFVKTPNAHVLNRAVHVEWKKFTVQNYSSTTTPKCAHNQIFFLLTKKHTIWGYFERHMQVNQTLGNWNIQSWFVNHLAVHRTRTILQVILSGFGINLKIYHKTAWTKKTSASIILRACFSPPLRCKTHPPDNGSHNHNSFYRMNLEKWMTYK